MALVAFLSSMVQSASCATTNNNNILAANRTISEKFVKLTGISAGKTEKLMEKWIGNRPWTPETSSQFDSEIIEPLKNLRIALLVVDFQNDFVNGSLKIGDGDAGQDPLEAIPKLNNLLENSKWDMIVYTKDWHPPNHISFLSQAYDSDRKFDRKSEDLKVFDSVLFTEPFKTNQTLYPDHCIQNSEGAEIYPDISIIPDSTYILKGTNPYLDSYSAFNDNNGKDKTDLEEILRNNGIQAVVIAGLAYDICVKFTCLDAVRLNFLSSVIPECSAGLLKNSIIEAEKEFADSGVAIISAEQAQKISNRSFIPEEWIRKLTNL
ncbi:unnamed protein product [Caenorhabditis angaria]|uniref:nicotinamidase n=1 Tax=Caenorhabditis angaria TaxID=860376 RepID=A0A9P1IM13_9PELO|nr:unnamed protein product [Caenorhabditis angaria]